MGHPIKSIFHSKGNSFCNRQNSDVRWCCQIIVTREWILRFTHPIFFISFVFHSFYFEILQKATGPFSFQTNFWTEKFHHNSWKEHQLWSLVTKYRKLCEIQSVNFVYLCIDARQSDDRIKNLIITSPCVIQLKVYKIYMRDCIFHILHHFVTKLPNFTKLMIVFPVVVMNFPNSKVRPKGELGPRYPHVTNVLTLDVSEWVSHSRNFSSVPFEITSHSVRITKATIFKVSKQTLFCKQWGLVKTLATFR